MTNREESTQFSLTELLRLEDERIAEVRRTSEDEKKAAERTRVEAAERAQQREKAEAAEAAARARNAQQAELDDLARREAMQKAIVEQARLDVEARTRTQERELERQHEIALAAMKTEGTKGQLGTILGGTAIGAATMLAVALAIHFAVLRPTNDVRIRELGAAVAAAEARATDLEQRVEEDRKVIAALRVRPADEPAPRAVDVHPPPPPRAVPGRPPARTGTAPTAPDPCAGSKDPLCGLPR